MIKQSTLGKAFEINKNSNIYGAFAEIGAGQETVNFFYKAGMASQTVAKSMSAYDMTVSDEIYGKQNRYVSKERLSAMLSRECRLLERRLKKKFGKNHCFFAYATTAATSTKRKKINSSFNHQHAWVGLRFQAKPMSVFNDIFFHISCLDRNRLQQHKAIGILGVNLIHACFYRKKTVKQFISSLADNLSGSRVEINGIHCSGPAFKNYSSLSINLELLSQNLSPLAYFPKPGTCEYLSDSTFGKSLIILYGDNNLLKNFRTKKSAYLKSLHLNNQQAVFIFLPENQKLKKLSLQQNLKKICKNNLSVILSSKLSLEELKKLVSSHTEKPINFIVSEKYFKTNLFDSNSYKAKSLLKALGDIFNNNTKMLVLSENKSFSIQNHKTKNKQTQNLKDYLTSKKQIINIV